jgi:hypothetical protein
VDRGWTVCHDDSSGTMYVDESSGLWPMMPLIMHYTVFTSTRNVVAPEVCLSACASPDDKPKPDNYYNHLLCKGCIQPSSRYMTSQKVGAIRTYLTKTCHVFK